MPRFTPNQLYAIQNNLNAIKRVMNKPTNISLNEYFKESSDAQVKRDPNLLKQHPAQFHNKNEWDGNIMRLEYTINKENMLREHFNQPDEEMQNYNIPMPVETQNNLLKKLNNIIREVQKTLSEDNLQTTYLNIVKLFNDFSLVYNANLMQLKEDKNFQMVFNERLITLEELINLCIKRATLNAYEPKRLVPKDVPYKFTSVEFRKAFDDILNIIKEMIITKNISMFVGERVDYSQVNIEPTYDPVRAKEIQDEEDARDEAERKRAEAERKRAEDEMHKRKRGVPKSEEFKGEKERGEIESEEEKGTENTVDKVLVAYKEEQNIKEGIVETKEQILENIKAMTMEERKQKFYEIIKEFLEDRNTEALIYLVRIIFGKIFSKSEDAKSYLMSLLPKEGEPKTPKKEEPKTPKKEEPKTPKTPKSTAKKNFKEIQDLMIEYYIKLNEEDGGTKTEEEIKDNVLAMTKEELLKDYKTLLKVINANKDFELVNLLYNKTYKNWKESRQFIKNIETKYIDDLVEDEIEGDKYVNKTDITYYKEQRAKIYELIKRDKVQVVDIKYSQGRLKEIKFSALSKDTKDLFKNITTRTFYLCYPTKKPSFKYTAKGELKNNEVKNFYKINGSLIDYIAKVIEAFIKEEIRPAKSVDDVVLKDTLNQHLGSDIKTESGEKVNTFISYLEKNNFSFMNYRVLNDVADENFNSAVELMAHYGF